MLNIKMLQMKDLILSESLSVGLHDCQFHCGESSSEHTSLQNHIFVCNSGVIYSKTVTFLLVNNYMLRPIFKIKPFFVEKGKGRVMCQTKMFHNMEAYCSLYHFY